MVPPFHLASQRTAYAAAGVGAAVALGWAMLLLLRDRTTPEERERQRRDRLAAAGRLVAGWLVDAMPSDTAPATLFYRYRVAGVEYECAQDVSALSYRLHDGVRVDFPVLVRYMRSNPPDSIVLAEAWSGLKAEMDPPSEDLNA